MCLLFVCKIDYKLAIHEITKLLLTLILLPPIICNIIRTADIVNILSRNDEPFRSLLICYHCLLLFQAYEAIQNCVS